MQRKAGFNTFGFLFLFLEFLNLPSYSVQEKRTIRFKSNYFDEFPEVLVIVDSLPVPDPIYELGLMPNINSIAFWKLEFSEPNDPKDDVSTSLSTAKDISLVVHLPSNLSSLIDHLNQIASLYRANRKRSDLFKPSIVILMPEEMSSSLIPTNFASILDEFQLDSKLFFMYGGANNSDDFSVWELYSLGNTIVLEEIETADNSILGAFLQSTKRRSNFHQHGIFCTAQNDPNYRQESEFERVNGTLKMVGGISVEIFGDLEFTLNFTSNVVQGEGWMAKSSNGTWFGMGRQVFAGEVDISISQSIFLTERSADFTFLHPTHSGRVQAFFRQPRSSYFRNIYKHAFGGGLWIISLLFWLIAALVIKITFKVTTMVVLPASDNDEELSRNSILWAIGTQCQQGWYQDPESRSVRIVFVSCSMCALIIYISFTGGLVSTLSTEVQPIQNLNELLSGHFVLMTDLYVPFIDDILEYAINSSNEPIRTMRDLSTNAVEAKHAINTIMSSVSAFLTLPDGFMSAFRSLSRTDQEFCQCISTLKVAKAPHRTGMFIRKGSPYKEFFNQKITFTLERGQNFRHRKRYVKGTTAQCIPKNVNYREGLDLRDVFSAFLILFTGFGLSGIISLIECIDVRLHRRRIYSDIILK